MSRGVRDPDYRRPEPEVIAEAAQKPEIRYVTLHDGQEVLDEVVARNADIHLECMADNHWWMIITAGGESVHVNLGTKRAKIHATAELD